MARPSHRRLGGLAPLLLLAAAAAVTLFSSPADAKKIKRVKAGTTYKTHDPVHVVVNKVGPFNNPTETYRYYSLPFCHTHHDLEDDEDIADHPMPGQKREGAVRHRQRLGESIVGDRRETSPYEITFKDNIEWRTLCKVTLDKEQMEKFKTAIHNSYFFEMFVEDLPMWGYIGDFENEDMMLGEVEGSKTYLYPHLHFRIGFNEGNVVSASVTTDADRRADITDTDVPTEVQFSYSTEWVWEKDLPWKARMTRYADSRFLPSSFEIHWLSIINSFVLVLLLTAFLTIILMRVLKNDFSRYMELDEETMEEEESGWKLIHGDVFRFPQYPAVFCAAVGTGTQLCFATLFLLCLALTGLISTTKRGSILAGVVVIYCLTAAIGGFVSTRLYLQMNGKMWVRCALLAAFLFPLPVVGIFSWVNTVAILHGSTSALPFTAVLTCLALYAFIAFPLTVAGAIAAKNYASHDFGAPTRTTKVAREIPTEVAWYRTHPFQMLIAGFLPFSAIYIELHYIFASMWGHQIYTLFGILLFAFVLLVIVCSFITVSLLYFQLAREDHGWWWISFVNGGMTGIFIYAYSFFYYFHRSGMTGWLQGSFYFGYMAAVSFGFFLMLGSAAFHFCLAFVRYIYGRIKCD